MASRQKKPTSREKETGRSRPNQSKIEVDGSPDEYDFLLDWNANLHFVSAKWLENSVRKTTASMLTRLGLEKAVSIKYPVMSEETIREVRLFVHRFDPSKRVLSSAMFGDIEITADIIRKAMKLKEGSEVYKKKRLSAETDDLFEKRKQKGNGYRIEKCKYQDWRPIMRVVNRLLLGSSKPETVQGDVAYFYKALLLEGGNPPWPELVLESLAKEVRLLKHHIAKLQNGGGKGRPHPFYATQLVSHIMRHVRSERGADHARGDAQGINRINMKKRRPLRKDCEQFDAGESRRLKRRLVFHPNHTEDEHWDAENVDEEADTESRGDAGGGDEMPDAAGDEMPDARSGDAKSGGGELDYARGGRISRSEELTLVIWQPAPVYCDREAPKSVVHSEIDSVQEEGMDEMQEEVVAQVEEQERHLAGYETIKSVSDTVDNGRTKLYDKLGTVLEAWMSEMKRELEPLPQCEEVMVKWKKMCLMWEERSSNAQRAYEEKKVSYKKEIQALEASAMAKRREMIEVEWEYEKKKDLFERKLSAMEAYAIREMELTRRDSEIAEKELKAVVVLAKERRREMEKEIKEIDTLF